ncbi:hypothetical protein C8R47DRAFT_1086489 [Mycena vitilis]|nr:hypothetical protein C8R47DRAFT_1086489 [Mycena vitilis]
MWNPWSGARQGYRAFKSDFRLHRLIRERPGIESCGYFHKNLNERFHVLGNVLRLIFSLLISPLIVIAQFVLPGGTKSVTRYAQGIIGAGGSERDGDSTPDDPDSAPGASDSAPDGDEEAWNMDWLDEEETDPVNAPDAVLTRSDGEDGHRYAGTGFQPRWLLKIAPRDGVEFAYDSFFPTQVNETDFPDGDWPPPAYTALSYSMTSAEEACKAAGLQLPQTLSNGRKYSLASRRQISKIYLKLYFSARLRKEGVNPDGVEYIWLDEFCISDAALDDHRDSKQIQNQRRLELGRMADIYRYADTVTVFCHTENCRHTDLSNCAWSKRIWTLAEILNAQTVAIITVTREPNTPGFTTRLSTQSGHVFREALQANAAKVNMWHMYAIFQRSDHGGAAPLQAVIHALVVEAIRRDEASNHSEHNLLGHALNGLLPRRAHLEDLGHGGWTDLAWLLELNQAFYNAAALAAVCSIISDKNESGSWLGKPINPSPGNERLEPIVTAFPIGRNNTEFDIPSDDGEDVAPPALTTPVSVGSSTGYSGVLIHQVILRRDGHPYIRVSPQRCALMYHLRDANLLGYSPYAPARSLRAASAAQWLCRPARTEKWIFLPLPFRWILAVGCPYNNPKCLPVPRVSL